MNATPYLSIIVTTRNDNHGGDLIKRTSTFIKGLYRHLSNYNFQTEIIIVEWNPPKDKPFLKDILPVPPTELNNLTLRYIIVPEEIHQQYSFSDRIPLFQMTAKNVGIRRASAEFVLCTNIDLLFSDELFQFFLDKQFKHGKYYRANRCDVPRDVINISNFHEQLVFCKNNQIKRLGKTHGHEFLFGLPRFLYGFKYSMKILNKLVKKIIQSSNLKYKYFTWSIDTAACGDFTLMSKNDWIKIEGYPELDLYSIHIDSMALIAAIATEIEQEILPPEMCSFHIYHDDGWESFANNPVALVKFMEKRPGLDWYTVNETGKWLLRNKKGWGLNKPDWGFVNEKFKEFIFEPGKPMKEIN